MVQLNSATYSTGCIAYSLAATELDQLEFLLWRRILTNSVNTYVNHYRPVHASYIVADEHDGSVKAYYGRIESLYPVSPIGLHSHDLVTNAVQENPAYVDVHAPAVTAFRTYFETHWMSDVPTWNNHEQYQSAGSDSDSGDYF